MKKIKIYKLLIILGLLVCQFTSCYYFDKSATDLESLLNTLFHRVYFVTRVYPIYLVGLIPYINRIKIQELIVRSSNKFDYIFIYFKKIIKYSFFYTVAITFFVTIISNIWSGKNLYNLTYIVLLIISQWIGWTFLGCLFTSIYLLIDNIVLTILVNMFMIMILNQTYYVTRLGNLKWYFSSKMSMYFSYSLNIFDYLKIQVYYCCLSLICLFFCYFILKKKDFIKKKNR